jgi:hypothetical protein
MTGNEAITATHLSRACTKRQSIMCLDYRFAGCEGAGLVKDDSVDMRGCLQHIATADEQPAPGACNHSVSGHHNAKASTPSLVSPGHMQSASDPSNL